MILRSSFVALLALPLVAQDQGVETGSLGSFYKAYFLDKEKKDKKSTAKAVELYQAFVAKHADHKLAGKAAANCVVLLYAQGAVDKAEAFATTHKALIASVPTAEPNDMMRMFGRGRGGGQENPNQELVDKLMGLHESAEGGKKAHLASAITRLGGARQLMMARFRGRGGFGGGRGGARGGRTRGFQKPKIAEMSKAEAQKAIEGMITSLERTIDSMAQRGQADQADALEEKLDKIQDLVDDGKMKDAQKIIDGLQVGGGRGGNTRRGRGGRGGDQGGRGGNRGGRGGDQGGRGRGGDRGGRGGR